MGIVAPIRRTAAEALLALSLRVLRDEAEEARAAKVTRIGWSRGEIFSVMVEDMMRGVRR